MLESKGAGAEFALKIRKLVPTDRSFPSSRDAGPVGGLHLKNLDLHGCSVNAL